MELDLYNTLTRKIEPFEPINSLDVRMYVCGPTVYDYAHIGNARPVIVFDVLFRLLRHIYGESHVKYVRNITDVDDKINARAAERGIDIRELTEETYQNFKADVAALGCLPPTVEPRATEHIEEMKAIIERLIAGKFAYIEQDHVLFSPNAMNAANGVLPRYGALANRSLDEMIAGARVDVAPYKRDVTDFVLWKPSKAGEPSWPSPGGIRTQGRPGWHIECSAMSWKHLGETFDIHGGGVDLVFPHHENEIAQSCCAFHQNVMANYWMHNGFLQVEGEKMSKSEGNFFTIRELRRTKRFGGRRWTGAILKLAMLQTHYTQPIDWTVRLLEQSELRLEKWRDFSAERTVRRVNRDLMNAFLGALCDDLNTPLALSIVDGAADEGAATPENRFTVYQIMKFLGVKARRTRIMTTAEKVQAVLASLGQFSQNDWQNIVASVRDRPLLKSGLVKPEAKLIVALDVLSVIAKDIVPDTSSLSPVSSFRNDLMHRGRPAESDFEARVRRLVAQRDEVRAAKNFAESDRIRDELAAMGVVLKDSKEGTTWEIAR